jgi:hypothetical protein
MRKRVSPTEDMATIDKPVPFGGSGPDTFERELVRDAFASLPKRWQTVLWQLDVDGWKPNELAAELGIAPNAVSALAYRAREGLRKAYLEQHVMTKGESWAAACKDVRRRLVVFVRGSATARDVIMIDPHLEACGPCMDAYLELEEVNSHLGGVSSALAVGFAASAAAPAAAGLTGGAVAKATLFAKSVIVALGSTAAVVATSVTVLEIPVESPAQAETVTMRPYSLTPEQEPDRTIGPVAVPTHEKAARSSSDESSSAAADTVPPEDQETTTTPTPETTTSPGVPNPVKIEVDEKGTTASVRAAGVDVSVSVDLHKLKDTKIEIKGSDKGAGPAVDKVEKLVASVVKK